MLKFGWSEVNITPEPGLHLEGMLNPPEAKGVKWPLYARTLIFESEQARVAIISLDLLFLAASTVREFREALAESTGMPPHHILIACSHTHRAPYTTTFWEGEPNFDYLDWVRDELVQGARAAMQVRKPACLKIGRVDAPGWTFNRRPVYRGEHVATHGPARGLDFLRMEGPEDNELQVLLAESPDGTPLGGLVNFACHPTLLGAEPVYSADYPGALTEELTRRHGATFAFLQGASANLGQIDLRREDMQSQLGPEYVRKMAQGLADKADEALVKASYVQRADVHVNQCTLSIPQRHPTKDQVKLARWYLEEAPEDASPAELRDRIYGHSTFSDQIEDWFGPENKEHRLVEKWFAREAIGMWEWQRRHGTRELVEKIELQAFVIGPVAVVAFPVELFTEFGLQVKYESPFEQTFIATLANGWHGYVPTRDAFDRGGYETRLAYQSRLARDAGDQLTARASGLLATLATF